MKATRSCSIDGCEKPVLARGWCSAHWTRWKRHGDPLGGGTPRQPLGDRCQADDECPNPPFSRGMCATHWRRDKAKNDPEGYEEHLAQRREWHAANPDKVAATRKRSREKHIESANRRSAEWRERNADRVLANNWTARRRSYGLTEDIIDMVSADILFERDGGVCQICKEAIDPDAKYPSPEVFTVDHVIPVVDPRSEHSYANTQSSHWRCNRKKNATQQEEQ